MEKGLGAVFQKHRLVPVKVNPKRGGLGVEGDGLGRAILVEDEEVVAPSNILGSEGDFHSVINDIKDFGEKAHNLVFFDYTTIYAISVPSRRVY